MERQLGADLSGVKVHTGGESAKAAEGLAARAFTVGQDVHFAAGEFSPGTKEGDRLLAHELTHVVQGRKSGIQRKPEANEGDDGGAHVAREVSHPADPAEKEADAVADHVSEDLHGDPTESGGREGADAGQEKAPAIGAKLESGVVSLAKKNDKKDQKKNVEDDKKANNAGAGAGGAKLKYVPSPKHAAGGWGTPMDLDDATAQKLLDESIPSGKQRYNYLNGKLYEFQPDNAGGWHGYPIPGTEAPSEVRKALRDSGKITPAEYKKLVKGEK